MLLRSICLEFRQPLIPEFWAIVLFAARCPVARRPKVAVIDDEIDLQEALAEYLEGYWIRREDGRVGLAGCERLLDTESFDLIVLDLNMPGSSGLDYSGPPA